MKWRILTVALAASLIALGLVSALIAERRPLPHRYLQHLEAQQLDDLSDTDRAAASSTATDPAHFASHLPVVRIETGGVEIPGSPTLDEDGTPIADGNGDYIPTLAADGSETIAAQISVYDAEDGANRLSDTPAVESLCQIRVRGNSSRLYEKKNYRIVLTEEDGTDNDQPLMGMEASETWALQGTSIDKTMLRNYVTYAAAAEFMDGFVPEVRFCEVFLDGSYHGLYLMTETIKVEEGRMQLTETDRAADATSYIVAIDEKTETDTTISEFLSYTMRQGILTTIIYPAETNLTEGQKAYIEQDLSDFEKALYSYDYDTPDYGYQNTLDTQSFVDSYVLNEFVINDDFGAYSTYLYKDIRGKVSLGPIWDYDNAYDLYQLQVDTEKLHLTERPWFFMLMKDEGFVERVIARYHELREGPLSEEHLNELIDETATFLAPALARNWQAWGHTFETDAYLEPAERSPKTHDEAIGDLKTFIHERGGWLDEHIENLRQYAHESAVKKFNH